MVVVLPRPLLGFSSPFNFSILDFNKCSGLPSLPMTLVTTRVCLRPQLFWRIAYLAPVDRHGSCGSEMTTQSDLSATC